MGREIDVGEAATGDTVRVHYTGKLADGTVFDTSEQRGPLEFTIGSGDVIPGFEKAVVGMTPGDERTADVPAGDAYGARRDDLVFAVERERLPEDLDLEVGQQLELRQQDGRTFAATVADLDDSTVTVDANHPLAGRDLTFEIELVEIV